MINNNKNFTVINKTVHPKSSSLSVPCKQEG